MISIFDTEPYCPCHTNCISRICKITNNINIKKKLYINIVILIIAVFTSLKFLKFIQNLSNYKKFKNLNLKFLFFKILI